jgi:ABC-type Zn uptake system ZnuABC Zn-binding protein ZnuA
LLDQARNKKLATGSTALVKAAEGIRLLEVPATLDRAQGDIHARGNPHFTTDPEAVRVIARHIARSFSSLDPGNAASYKANLQGFEKTLNARMQQWKKQLAPWRGRHLVAYHDSWPYFANRFGLKIDLFLEPKPGISPSPTHLAKVIGAMRRNGAKVILVDPYVSVKAANAVARHTGAKVLKVMPCPQGKGGRPGDYFQWMDGLVNSISKALAGNG